MVIDHTKTATVATTKLLLGNAVLALLLGLYQWIELVVVRTGGTPPLCTLGEHINCVTVWGSPLAQWVHAHSGLPLAAWGVAWGAILLSLAARIFVCYRRGEDSPVFVGAIKLTSTAGVAVAIVLLFYSISIKVFCPTCLLSYVFVAIAAYLAYARLPATATPRLKSAYTAVLTAAIAYTLLLYPGLHTPYEDTGTAALHTTPVTASSGDALADFLQSQPPQLQQIISNYLAIYRAAPIRENKPDPQRLAWGNVDAPVHLVDWIDIRCPHCKKMSEELGRIRNMASPNTWNEEERNFPLDSECNAYASRSDGSGVHCLAAKILICLAGTPRAQEVREQFFSHQEELSRERVWQLAAPDTGMRPTLESCVKSSATIAALRSDVNAAVKYNIEGTPLVVVNGRNTPPVPALIYALILARGDSDARGFAVLPPPQTETIKR